MYLTYMNILRKYMEYVPDSEVKNKTQKFIQQC